MKMTKSSVSVDGAEVLLKLSHKIGSLSKVLELSIDDSREQWIKEHVSIFNQFAHISNQFFVKVMVGQRHLLGLSLNLKEFGI